MCISFLGGKRGDGEERGRWGRNGEVGMKREGWRRGNGRGGRKVSGERGREGESHAFEFCQLESSANLVCWWL